MTNVSNVTDSLREWKPLYVRNVQTLREGFAREDLRNSFRSFILDEVPEPHQRSQSLPLELSRMYWCHLAVGLGGRHLAKSGVIMGFGSRA